MEKEKKVFRSRISVVLVVILLLPLIVDVVFIHKATYREMYLLGAIYLFIILTILGIRYVISDNNLSLKILWFIPFGGANTANIVSVKRTFNPLSSLSASFKRLSIRSKTGFGWMLVSPVREQEFLDALKEINPDIYIRVSNKTGWWRIWDWDI